MSPSTASRKKKADGASEHNRKQIRVRKGVTLIELMIVVAIIVGIASVIWVSLDPAGRIEKARDTKVAQSASQMTKALNIKIVDDFAIPIQIVDGVTTDICKYGDSGACVSLDDLVNKGYIGAIPVTQEHKEITDPISGYQIFRDGGYVEICRKGTC